MEWAKQAAAQAKQLRERAAQEASKLQESYKDGTLASPLAERLSLDAVSASLKEGRQKLREGVETAIEAGADASRRTMDAMGENERVDEVIKSKNARILALEEERAKHRHALAERDQERQATAAPAWWCRARPARVKRGTSWLLVAPRAAP